MMKKLLTVLITAATMVGAMAEVPSLINYQGRLKEKSGSNVNGTKNFIVRIFDAKEGGKQTYEENVGAVNINEGAYSFGFGEAGNSAVKAVEAIGFGDGEKQIFNYVVRNPPMLSGIKITGLGYSWTESGSSDISKFTATAIKDTGAVSAIFIAEAPNQGAKITIEYDHPAEGVMGALSSGKQSWLEISVSGEVLSPRERLVTVPYALRADVAEKVKTPPERVLLSLHDILMTANFGVAENSPRDISVRDKENSYLHNKYPHYKDGIHFYVTNSIKSLDIKIIAGTAKYWSQKLRPQTKALDISNVRLARGSTLIYPDKINKTHFSIEAPEEGFYTLSLSTEAHFDREHFMEAGGSIIVIGK